uniref:C2H2-type domain-containing protein n=1 Tax=Parascaris equorum TaxID=6256 RepID=A0A914S5Y6_PAREQ
MSLTKCPLLLKEAHIAEQCCSSASSSCSSGYGSALPSNASQVSLSSLSSRVDSLDLSSLKEPLSIVCDNPESTLFLQPQTHLEILRPTDCLSPTSRVRCSPKGRLKSLACKWGDCKMAMSRGDLKKQECTLRFTLKRALEDHLRSGHEKTKGM